MSRDFQTPWPPSSVYGRFPIVLRNSEIAAFTKDGWLRLASAGDPSGQLEIRDASIDALAIVRTDKANGSALVQTQNDARAFQIGVGPDDAFRVYDLTATTSPFLIESAAPDYSLYVDSSGSVGLGTSSPGADGLHIVRSTGAGSSLLKMTNNSGSYMQFENTSSGESWFFTSEAASPHRFIISSDATAGAEFALTTTGDLTVSGSFDADAIRIRTSSPPASSSATGSPGEIRWDSSFLYLCTATDTWKRAALATY